MQRYDTSDTARVFALTPARRPSRIALGRSDLAGGVAWMSASTKTLGCNGTMATTPSGATRQARAHDEDSNERTKT